MNCRDAEGSQVDNIFDRSGINIRTDEMINEDFFQSPMRPDGIGSFASEGNDILHQYMRMTDFSNPLDHSSYG